MNFFRFYLLILASPCLLVADQFTLFDETFTFEAKDAVQTQSHLYVKLPEKTAHWPTDWTQPIDYRNGSVHVRVEVLEKPSGGAPTHWSLCYIGRKSAVFGKPRYGCLSTPNYTAVGVYESTASMNQFWNNQCIDWTEGVQEFHLVIKAKAKSGDNGMSHAHRQQDLSKFFPTKVRIRVVQVSAGDSFNPNLVQQTAATVYKQTKPQLRSTTPTRREFRPIIPR